MTINEGISAITQESGRRTEALVLSLGTLLFILFHWRFLVIGQTMLTHDAMSLYPGFIFLSDSLKNGVIPYWNPYFHAGEPFHFLVTQLCLLDWVSIGLIFLNQAVLNIPLITLYNINFIIHILIFAYGSYFFFRYIVKYKTSAYLAFFTVLFSSTMASSFRIGQLLPIVLFLPVILLYLLKTLAEGKSLNILLASFFIGLQFNYYQPVFIVITAIIFTLSVILFAPHERISVLLKKHKPAFLLGIVLILMLSAVPIEMYLHKNDIIPMGRLATSKLTEGVSVSFDQPGGSYSSWNDFVGLLLPNFYLTYYTKGLGDPFLSDAILYVGILPLILAGIGVCFGKNPYKIPLLICLILTIFLMVGKNTFTFLFAYYFLPFYKLFRHMEFFSGYFIFLLICFAGMGADVLSDAYYAEDKEKIMLKLSHFTNLMNTFNLILVLIILVFFSQIFYHQDYVIWFSKMKDFLSAIVLNQFFFLAAVLAFYLVRQNSFSKKNLMSVFILISLFDLLNFNYGLMPQVTRARDDKSMLKDYSPVIGYSDFRVPFVPRQAGIGIPTNESYEPVLNKKFSYEFEDERKFLADLNQINPVKDRSVAHALTSNFVLKDYFVFRIAGLKADEIMAGLTQPKVSFMPQAIILKDRSQLVSTINSLDEEQIKKTVFFTKADAAQIRQKYPATVISEANPDSAQQPTGNSRASIKVMDFDVNSLSLKVKAPSDGFIYYSDIYYKGWKAYLDQAETSVYRTNLAFKSAFVPKGEHTLKFEYSPASFKTALLLYTTAFWGFILGWLVQMGRRYFKINVWS
ncbi:MAG: YfhO family protein [Candidatus Schekmanbacteria bacterium]|nr:YfhO family protein [Candidatus Schekmanbacteria bacterium]